MPIKDIETASYRLGKLCDNILYYAPNEREPRNGELQGPCYKGGANFIRLLISASPESFNSITKNFPKGDANAQKAYLTGISDFIRLLVTGKPEYVNAMTQVLPKNDEALFAAFLAAIGPVLSDIDDYTLSPGLDGNEKSL